ncbi:MAG TPA: nuclear transport factor 2 family protein, partial [Bradyrhizobium sp.]|nr:nuclear transport factor 2 family protein [Bradyrhizobium sp.]
MLDKAPDGKISDLLNALDKALSAGEVERVVDLFQTDCYWRDLVTFTWNIKTMEGRDQVRDMLKARLADTKPSNWKIADGEDASEADGITESWIQFETGVARGFGHLRLKDGRIWTLLTTMSELKGHEEPVGFDRPMGAKHGAERNRKTWKEEREAEAAELGYSRQPCCVIVGGGQGGIAL